MHKYEVKIMSKSFMGFNILSTKGIKADKI